MFTRHVSELMRVENGCLHQKQELRDHLRRGLGRPLQQYEIAVPVHKLFGEIPHAVNQDTLEKDRSIATDRKRVRIPNRSSPFDNGEVERGLKSLASRPPQTY